MFLRRNYKNLFKGFLLFAILYNGYRYFFPWVYGNKPHSPFYLSILKDVPWAVITLSGLYVLFCNRTPSERSGYKAWGKYRHTTMFFIVTHIVLLGIALIHIPHKNIVDIFQRDIKNVQYIFLPLFFRLLIEKEDDIFSYVDWIIFLGILVSLFGFITYFFIPGFTWNGEVLSTFQSPNNYGFFTAMLSLLVLARIFFAAHYSSMWHIILCVLFGALLTSLSVSALLSFLAGGLFIIILAKPAIKPLLKLGVYFLIASVFFSYFGLFNNYLDKARNSLSSYRDNHLHEETSLPEDVPASPEINTAPVIASHETEQKPLNVSPIVMSPYAGNKSSVLELLKTPYEPTAANGERMPYQYSSIGGRVTYLREFISYLKKAGAKDILWGDFSLTHYYEYDNVYFYFIRNNGVLITILHIILFIAGGYTGLRKYGLYLSKGNREMAGLSLGLSTILLTDLVIQFNMSYYLTMYPLNFLTYFFLILVFFINPADYEQDETTIICI